VTLGLPVSRVPP